MDKDIIFCFTGTGNSLKVSKDIAASLGDCTIYHIGSANNVWLVYSFVPKKPLITRGNVRNETDIGIRISALTK